MTWNYRVMKHRSKHKPSRGVVYYGLHEVFYRKNGAPYMCSENPDVTADTKEELIYTLAMMIRDATKTEVPILDYDKPPWEKKQRNARKGNGKKRKA